MTKRIGDFAAKRQMLVGYHTHTQGSLTVFDEALAPEGSTRVAEIGKCLQYCKEALA